MEPVRWGVLGVSGHYRLRVHAPIAGSPLVELRAIASRDGEKARAAAGRLGFPAAYGSYEELLEDGDVEAVYIPLPNHLHLEYIRKAADAGKHVLCEKPLALNAAEARRAVEHARNRGLLLMEAFMYRFHPQWRRVREIVRTGEIGPVRVVQTYFAFNNRDPKNIRNRLEAGGGALMDIGCYAVSAARFVLEAEPQRVLSLVGRDPDFGTDILSSAILDFGTARSVFTVGTQTFPSQRVDILGASGRITVHLPFNSYPDVPMRVTVTVGLGGRELQLGPADAYRLEFEAFSRAVRDGAGKPSGFVDGVPAPANPSGLTPPEDAVANMEVLDALFRSAGSGGWEPLPR